MCERCEAEGKREKVRVWGKERRKVRAVLGRSCAILEINWVCGREVGSLSESEFGRDWRRHCLPRREIGASDPPQSEHQQEKLS